MLAKHPTNSYLESCILFYPTLSFRLPLMSFAWSKESPRIYAEKATQTEESDKPYPKTQDGDVPATQSHSIGSPHDKPNNSSEVPLSEFFPINYATQNPRLGSIRSQKQAQLLSIRPNHTESMFPPGKRIVSLPEISGSGALCDLNIPVPSAPRMRVVSLPEIEHSPARTSIDNSVSFESSEFSLETSFRSSRQGSVHRAARTGPLSDLPQTPSPPSSPEPVSITDSHNYFLGSIQHQNYKDKDEGGICPAVCQ